MARDNTLESYGLVARCFHWTTALGIIILIPLGLYAAGLPHDTDAELTRKAWLFSLHKTLGVVVFLVALLRILWAMSQPHPLPLHPTRRAETVLAGVVHYTLYGALIVVPLSGWIGHAAAAGFAPILWPFGQTLPLVPQSTTVEHAFSLVHDISGKILIAALLLHVAGALKHHLFDRDATLRRMVRGATARPASGDTPARAHRLTASLTALAVWAVAIGAGLALSNSETAPRAAPAPTLEQAASQWEVREGALNIDVMQFGSTVSGSFADWTAVIAFDQHAKTPKVGTVTVTIAIGSLSLGSVTEQALGADLLDADGFPTAVFQADLHKTAEGHEARGNLTLKGNSVPVTLPFMLEIDGTTARMTGQLSLDRRDFRVGDTMTDPENLGFGVDVRIALTAERKNDL